MGTFRHPLILYSLSGDRSETVEAVVDTGSTFTWVPAPILERLGIYPDRERTFILADGTQVRRGMAEVQTSINGERMTTPIVFAPPGSHPALGAVTLEQFSLAADVTNKRLVPAENYAL